MADSDRDLHRRAGAIFRAAVELPGEERAAFLEAECGGDPALLEEVRSLLEADAGPSRFDLGIGRSLLEDVSAPPVPARIGSYVVEARIGAGGMGTVYRARQSEPDRVVALKVLRLHGGGDALRRFRNEAQILGRLVHPNLAQVHESGTAETADGAVPYIAMELVDGEPIDAWAAGRAIDERLRMVAIVARAVGYAHANGVVHRDLKPANILVTRDGAPKILDFGVARVTDDALLATVVETRAGQVVGTLPYMSPEQLRGNAALDARCDVYALGVLLYRLLAGHLPPGFDTESIAEAARTIAEVDPPRLGTIDRALRGDVETIVARALQKDPAHRYQSAGELAADLERHLGHEPILARPTTTFDQVRKFARRHPAVVAGVVGIVAVSLIGAAVSVSFALRAARERERAALGFTSVRGLVRTLVDDFDQAIVDLPGALPARRLVAERTIAYLELLEREAGDDPAVLLDVAMGFATVGDIQGQTNRPNLGDRDGALASYARGLAAAEWLVELDPGSIEGRRHVAIINERIGNVHMTERDYEAALACYERSHALKAAVAADTGGGALDLSFSLNKLSQVYGILGRTDEALAAATTSLEHRRGLLDEAEQAFAARPDDETVATLRERQRQVSTGHNRVGDLLLQCDRAEDALREFELALGMRQALAESDPTSAGARRDVAVSAYRTALASERLGRFDAALAAYETVARVMAWLSELAPQDRTAALDHAGILAAVGALRAAHGDAAAARTELLESVRIFDELDDVAGAEIQGGSFVALARLELDAGRVDDARRWSTRAVEAGDALVRANPGVAGPHRLRARALQAQGDVAAAAGEADAARRARRAALAAWGAVEEHGPLLDDDRAAMDRIVVQLEEGDRP